MTACDDPCHADAGGGLLVIVCGLPGSGKTTRAATLADERNGLRLGPDDWMDTLGANLWDAAMRDRERGMEDPPITRADLAEWRRHFEAPDDAELSTYDKQPKPEGSV